MAAHNNWNDAVAAAPLDLDDVKPWESPLRLKYVGPAMVAQLQAEGINTLQDLIDLLSLASNQTEVRQWLEQTLQNPRSANCVGVANPVRNHGQPNRYRVRRFNKFAYNSLISWLDTWWNDVNRFYRVRIPRRSDVIPSGRRRARTRQEDKLPPLLVDRAAGVAFPIACAPIGVPVAPAAPAVPPAPPVVPRAGGRCFRPKFRVLQPCLLDCRTRITRIHRKAAFK